jgi:hypothetical protein
MRSSLVPVLLVLGCAHPLLDLGPAGEASTAAELLRRVDAVEATVTSVSGEARLEVSGPRGRAASALFLAVGRSASLHLEQLDFFGRPQLVLVSDGARFTLHEAGAGRWYRGPVTGAALGRLLPLSLPWGAMAPLLLGRAPRPPGEAAELRLDRERRRYLLSVGLPAVQLEVDPASARVLRSAGPGLEVRFSDLEARGGVVFPMRVELDLEAGPTSLALRWTEVTLEPPEDPSLFVLEPPPGVPVTELDDQGLPVAQPETKGRLSPLTH